MTGRDRLLVLLGGGVGALLRVTAVEVVPLDAAATTLGVNLAGALLLGVLVGAVPTGDPRRALVGTGVLGGFTTFSALAVQVADRLDGSGLLLAVVSVVGGLAAAAAGLRLGALVTTR